MLARLMTSFLGCALAVGALGSLSPGASAAPEPSYYGVYLKGVKIGALTMRRDGEARLGARPAVRTDTRLSLDLQVAGRPSRVVSETATWAEPQTGLPLLSDVRTVSGGAETRVRATYTSASVSYVVTVTGREQKATLNLRPGERFLSDPWSQGIRLSVGQSFRGKVFQSDPALLRLTDSRIEIIARETLTIDGKPTLAFKVEDRNPAAPATMYLNDRAELLRTESTMGLRIERQAKAAALAPSVPADLSRFASVVPSGDVIGLRRASAARYEVRGLSRPLPASDAIQQAMALRGASPNDAVVTVTPQTLPTGPTAPRFGRPSDAPRALQKHLLPTLYVSSDQPDLIRQARQIVGDDDTGRAAAKLARYVHQTIRFDPTISSLRSASDIRRDPKGVCRDYTLYFTALARAAGIPTRQCVGLAFADGRFSGHAWPEVWTGTDAGGRDRWVALEPTWGAPQADATHIKLSEGEITDFFAVASDLGRLTIKVLSAPPAQDEVRP